MNTVLPTTPNTALPTSIDDTAARLLALDYVPERALATTVFLALKLQRPLFLEGEPGTGKTEIAKTLAANWSAGALKGATVSAADLNSDLHGSAEYRAALIPVLAGRAVS